MKKKVSSIFVFVVLMLCFVRFDAHAQMAKDKCKFIGNIIASNVPGDFSTYWNQITPENAGKWGTAEPTRDNPNWTGLDLAYNEAKTKGYPFKQHTFVWGQQQPNWIGGLTQDEQREEVEEWIKTYCERYPETDYIDVVNEPLHAAPSYALALGGNGSTGWDWVIWSFEKARQYCPDAKLVLNDYNIISNIAATNTYIQIINLLKERDLIDVVGEQGHFLETTPLNTIKENLDKLQATGLPIHISEFDVNIADDAQQRAKYEELFPVLWNHKGVHGITLWGYRQNQIWREDAYLLRGDGTIRPAMTWLTAYVPNTQGGSFCLPVSTTEEVNGISVYPNPSHGRITVELTGDEFELRLIDTQGHEQVFIKTNATSQDLEIDKPGLYILKISGALKSTFRKIIVK